jgi:hypothetical protein
MPHRPAVSRLASQAPQRLKSVNQFLRKPLNLIPEGLAGFEFDNILSLYLDFFTGLGIASLAGFTVNIAKRPEPNKCYAAVAQHLLGNTSVTRLLRFFRPFVTPSMNDSNDLPAAAFETFASFANLSINSALFICPPRKVYLGDLLHVSFQY